MTAIYPKAKEVFGTTGIHWLADTIKVCLVTTAYNAAHQFRLSLTGVAGGVHGTLSAKTVVGGVFDAADTTMVAVAAGPAVVAAVVYRDTGNPATDQLITYQGITPVAPDGSDITVAWPATGVFRLLAPGFTQTRTLTTVTPTRVIGIPVMSTLPVSGGLSVVITRDSDGATATYTELEATVLDDYVDPGGQFTMGCKIAALNPTFPQFHPWFRSDKIGTPRDEIVFEYGYCFSAFIGYMTAYHASIRKNGVEVANFAVPFHAHQSRWRWQSAVRPPNRFTRQQLIDQGYVPPYSAAPTKGFTGPSAVQTYSHPMDTSGLDPFMGDTGDRQEIGMITNQQADWIINGTTAALNSFMAQAEAAATWPWHHRDETTAQHNPLDPYVYIHASMANVNNPSPYLTMDAALDNNNGGQPFFFQTLKPDVAHHPSLSYLPWLLTGDPYHLEELQFVTTYTLVVQPNGSRSFCNYFAIRAMGWSARTAGQALKAMPTALMPGWLLSRSWFQTYLNDFRAYLDLNFLNNASAPWATFHTVERQFGDNAEGGLPTGTYGQNYMEEYVSCCFSYVAWMGNTDWIPIANWKRDHTAKRTSSSGWEIAIPEPYRQKYRDVGWPQAAGWYTTWAQSWTATKAVFDFTGYTPGVLLCDNAVITDYNTYARCALVWGKYFGDTNVDAGYAFVNDALMSYGLTASQRCNWKWSIAPPP